MVILGALSWSALLLSGLWHEYHHPSAPAIGRSSVDWTEWPAILGAVAFSAVFSGIALAIVLI